MRSIKNQPTIKKMATSTFINLEEVFCQRDTAKRVNTVVKRLSQNPLPTHCMVSLAKYPDGKHVILDGNTRRLAWELFPNLQPEQVIATVYNVQDDAQAKNIYEGFDSADAVEKSTDKIYSALKMVFTEEELQNIKSDVIKSGRLTSTLRYSVNQLLDSRGKQTKKVKWKRDIANLADYINYYKEEIIALDNLLVSDTAGEYSVRAAQMVLALLMLKKHGADNQRALDGLHRIFSNDYIPVETTEGFGKIDAVCWMNKFLDSDQMYTLSKGTNETQMTVQLNYLLSLFERWMSGGKMANNPSAKKPNMEGFYKGFFKKNNFKPLVAFEINTSTEELILTV